MLIGVYTICFIVKETCKAIVKILHVLPTLTIIVKVLLLSLAEFFLFTLFFFLFSVVVVGFTETTYTVSEGDGVAVVTVKTFEGTVGDGECFNLQCSTQENTAKMCIKWAYDTHNDFKKCLLKMFFFHVCVVFI